ncbi:MAG: formate dehydrogenase accessory sulfurtransferase FdhD [Cyclobacteriaceae bacterium]|nr:formate dehydrogenase accessory sulfurtransferase FdhD [Cyclobacteriaceae bacterium]UYN85918.1 MAG: formate dehydrogenase accessory sulfurtransferase FdhD [Cyclobacteriaceae bacterium]
MAHAVRPVEIIKVTANNRELVSDLVATEEPLEIRLGYGQLTARQQKSLSVTMRTPGHDFELALGFLFTEGIIQSFDQVESIKYCEDVGRAEEKENVVRVEVKPEVIIDFEKLQRNFYTTSSCGVCGKSSINAVSQLCPVIPVQWMLSPEIICELPQSLRKSQHVFEYTGGLHASGLFGREGSLVLLREDVGRHNALDKVVGAMLVKNEIPLYNSILLVSGRASFELVQKAAMAGIPVLVSVGAPSSLAVELAIDSGITLLGFVRDNRFNIYSGQQRITA